MMTSSSGGLLQHQPLVVTPTPNTPSAVKQFVTQGKAALAGACDIPAAGKAIVSGRLWQGPLGDTPPQERGSQR